MDFSVITVRWTNKVNKAAGLKTGEQRQKRGQQKTTRADKRRKTEREQKNGTEEGRS
jgi:hypothetical protein